MGGREGGRALWGKRPELLAAVSSPSPAVFMPDPGKLDPECPLCGGLAGPGPQCRTLLSRAQAGPSFDLVAGLETWMPLSPFPTAWHCPSAWGLSAEPGQPLGHHGSPGWLEGRQEIPAHCSGEPGPGLSLQAAGLAGSGQSAAGMRSPALASEPSLVWGPEPGAGRAWHTRRDGVGSWPPLNWPLLHRGRHAQRPAVWGLWIG